MIRNRSSLREREANRMHEFFFPYLEMMVACAYSLQQNLEGGGFVSIWHGQYIDIQPQISIVVAVYALFMGGTFLLSLIAAWSYSRVCFLLVLLLWLAPGVASAVGFQLVFAAIPQKYTAGSGEPGETWGTLLNYALALLFGWSVITLLANVLRAGERAKHAYDHLWYSLGLTGGLFFVVTWHNTNVRTELATAEGEYRAAAEILASQLSALGSRCTLGGSEKQDDITSPELCDWAQVVGTELYKRRYEPVFTWRFDPKPDLEFFLTLQCQRHSPPQGCIESHLAQVDLYNERMCSAPRATGLCRTVPETLNRDARLSANIDLFFQHYALAIRPLAPTLSQDWKKASDMSERSHAEESEPHRRWLYFLGFAGLAGGKVSFASASLFRNSRCSLVADGLFPETNKGPGGREWNPFAKRLRRTRGEITAGAIATLKKSSKALQWAVPVESGAHHRKAIVMCRWKRIFPVPTGSQWKP